MVQSCYHIHTCAVRCKWPLHRAWEGWKCGPLMLAFDLSELWQILVMSWMEQIQMWELHTGLFEPSHHRKQTRMSPISLASHISSCASRSGPSRSVPFCQQCSQTEQQVHEIVNEPMACAEGGEAGKHIGQIANVLKTSLLGKGRF